MRWLKRAVVAVAPTFPRPLVTGRCIKCKEYFRVDRDGNVRTHGLALPTGGLCTGSNRPPEIEW